ncbi:MAG: hypothetical protein N3G22_01805 [Candidatus Micrarchaeota archaeon]|nr:hypothetical protein [Candidatus Micrarchaeota archaeon]
MPQQQRDEPFSARYSLPAQVSATLKEVSWESVVQLSSDFQIKVEQKSSRVRKVIKEIQLSRILLMDRIRQGNKTGRLDPKLLVDTVRLLQRCEEIAKEYDIDLHEFSSFLYLVAEKLKKEKLAKIPGRGEMAHFKPMKDESARLKAERGKKGRKQ